ncbi:IclR family transcriptional regulator [Pantoea sp. At-9b]|uniref:IclR family transcriptional regulator n=1 Tax=Pantoea sp. (strain At-9b) TaxID=592316 RepID=UPI0001B3F8DE|nr:IclR family transcriptional regulator [Pantoea sp. At-9b]ADU72908.1 transcriptional regulator, IclR family [Pantoea sp. At-9b]
MSQVLEKAVYLVDLVAKGITTLTDIAKAADMSRSTTHRLLGALVDANYLAFENKRYALGYRLLELGEMKKRSLDFIEVCRPVLVRYMELTQDTLHLAVIDGQDIVLLDRVAGHRQLRINSYPGLRNKAFMTAVGKVLIGNQPEETWKTQLRSYPAGYAKTVEQLMQDFRLAQKTNVARDIDECNVGTCGIASSFMVNNRLRIACSINGATVYFPPQRMEELVPVVRQLAEDLREAIDYSVRGGEFLLPGE